VVCPSVMPIQQLPCARCGRNHQRADGSVTRETRVVFGCAYAELAIVKGSSLRHCSSVNVNEQCVCISCRSLQQIDGCCGVRNWERRPYSGRHDVHSLIDLQDRDPAKPFFAIGHPYSAQFKIYIYRTSIATA